ncbi:MAG: hypothetical protein LUD27_02985, partial [Clostridia bacterium]|nr:hypothetical protein [Clostridia bacterium]
MLAYFPGCWILNMWLPNYSPSLGYLALLLPLIIFSSKMNLLTNNYLKVYRREKVMFVINVSAAVLGTGAFLLCAYVFNSLEALLLCVVAVIMICSVVSEIAVMKIIGVKFIKEFIFEFLLTAGFILAAYKLGLLWGFLAYLAMFAVYCAVNYKSVAEIFKAASARFKGARDKNKSKDGEE